jgi:serine/threonine protein kinase
VDNICWLAPEVLAQDICGYSFQSDVYSVGIAALELATGEAPFAGLPVTEIMMLKLRGHPPVLMKKGDGETDSQLSNQLSKVVLFPRFLPARYVLCSVAIALTINVVEEHLSLKAAPSFIGNPYMHSVIFEFRGNTHTLTCNPRLPPTAQGHGALQSCPRITAIDHARRIMDGFNVQRRDIVGVVQKEPHHISEESKMRTLCYY